jgi:hypothetical protein
MKFKNDKYIIEIDFKYKAGYDEYIVQHNRENNKIEIDITEWINLYRKFEIEPMKREFKKMLVHEITHWFDWNSSGSESWEHTNAKMYEMLAKFNELFHNDIEEFSNMIMESKQVKKHLKEVTND